MASIRRFSQPDDEFRRIGVTCPGLVVECSRMTTAFVLGVLAGLSVAMPVGPVGVLLVRSGLVDGVRVAVGAACGVATVDLAYAVLAVAVGAPVSRVLGEHAALVRWVSAGVLVGVGVLGVASAARASRETGPVGTVAASPSRAYLRFVGLTAVNPLTAITFTTIAVGLAAQVGGAGSVSAFVVGVGLASLAWQLALAVTSGLLGLRVPPSARRWVSMAGAGVVVLAGVALVV
jgi:threonine/homoserine/homoserine lactone efflux protein